MNEPKKKLEEDFELAKLFDTADKDFIRELLSYPKEEEQRENYETPYIDRITKEDIKTIISSYFSDLNYKAYQRGLAYHKALENLMYRFENPTKEQIAKELESILNTI